MTGAARSESRIRTELVGVRLEPAEFAEGLQFARACGVTLPSLLRQLLLDAVAGRLR